MRSTLRIRRLQIAGKSLSAPLVRPATAPIRLDPRPAAPSCLAGPSSRPYSSAAPHLRTNVYSDDAQNSYFTASRPVTPLASSSRLSAPTIADDESERLAQLHERLSLPASSRTEQVARRTFDLYRSLSPFTRHQLPQDLIRTVLRNIVPSTAHLDDRLSDSRSPSLRNAQSWEERLRFVIADISASRGPHSPTSTGETSAPDCWGDYKFAMNRLARAGSMDAVESIVGDMRLRGLLEDKSTRGSLRVHEIRLQAIRNRLVYLRKTVDMGYKTSIQRHLNRLDDIFPVFWRVVNDLRKDGLVPKQLTCTLIVQNISLFWYALPNDHPQAGHLGELFHEVLRKGYGLDMEYLTVNKTESKADIQAFVVRAIVDYLGRQGDVWKMLSAFEVLTQTSSAEAEYRSNWNKEDSDEDDVGPTLAEMEAKEKLERSGMTLWQDSSRIDRAVDSAQIFEQPINQGEGRVSKWNTFNDKDFLPCTTLLPSTLATLPSEELEALASGFDPAAQGMEREEMFSIMLRHASAARNYPLAQHILRVAIRDTQELRQRWLARIISRARIHHATAQQGTSEWTGIRNLRKPALEFDEHWFISVRRLVMGRFRRTGVKVTHGDPGPTAQLFALLEEAERWLQEEEAVLHGPLYPYPAIAGAVQAIPPADATLDQISVAKPAKRAPLLGDIYDLTTHRASIRNALDRIQAVHSEAVEQRATLKARLARKWLSRKARREEAEETALQAAEKKAAGLAERQARKRVVAREIEERDEGMMLAAATT